VPTPENAPEWFRALLETELSLWITLSATQIERLYKHYELLLAWNKRINLTSIQPGSEMILRHYCESLFLGAHIPARSDDLTIADIGSGPGLPGVPLAILQPGWRLTLIESNQRKAVFLREATRDLSNVSVLAKRAKDVSTNFDWIVSRAVDPMEVLVNIPRLAPRVGLLLGQADISGLKTQSIVAWAEPIRLPWGDRRFCVYGEVP